MLGMAPKRPPLSVASAMLASVFGAGGVQTGGGLFDRAEGRGDHRGLRVRVELSMHQTRTEVAPFTLLDVEEDLDVIVSTGGSGVGYPAHEVFVPLPGLAPAGLIGAPRALTERIAAGPVGERLARTGMSSLAVGASALREGCATRGVHLQVRGWPADEATLRFLLDTVAETAAEARRELASATAPNRGGRHPEVVAYEVARAASRKQGLRVVAGVGAGLLLLSVLLTVAIVASR